LIKTGDEKNENSDHLFQRHGKHGLLRGYLGARLRESGYSVRIRTIETLPPRKSRPPTLWSSAFPYTPATRRPS
jgi:hypothetical protein